MVTECTFLPPEWESTPGPVSAQCTVCKYRENMEKETVFIDHPVGRKNLVCQSRFNDIKFFNWKPEMCTLLQYSQSIWAVVC